MAEHSQSYPARCPECLKWVKHERTCSRIAIQGRSVKDRQDMKKSRCPGCGRIECSNKRLECGGEHG